MLINMVLPGAVETARLPKEYQEVEYIESTGTQWIDTGFRPNQNTRIVIDTMPTSIANISVGGDGFSPYAAGNSPYFECYSWNSAILFAYNTQEDLTTPIALGGRVTIDHNKNVVTTTDSNGNVYTVTFSYASFTTNSNLGLCCLNRTTKYWGKQRIYSCQVYDNDVLLRDFVPCYRISDVVAGMYDLVEGVFYTNAGTGTFTKGADVSGGGSSSESLEFTYSGNYTDNRVDGIGTVRLNTSGTLTVLSGTATVSAYILAGGGGAIMRYTNVGATGGGGGNQTVEVELAPGTYEVIIGTGGIDRELTTGYAGDGGNTTAFGITCTGGKGGYTTESRGTGGAGGTPNGGAGKKHDNVSSTPGGSPNGGALINYWPEPGGDGYVELTFI